ncbi:GntR family transcriptional regulator [Pseudothermotoga sp. U03pept]|uniref:GntR family transcriptional regulator n=1 Tax=Pseudothermotoga sp. U03pept TaxID=3447012 RepID=UPI003EFFE615
MQRSYSVESIYIDLRTKIESGYYSQDRRLPDEKQLASIYGVGKQAIRLAIKKLVDEGAVKRVKGRGTFVLFTPKEQLLGLIDSSWDFRILRKNLGNAPKDCPYFEREIVLSFEILWHTEERKMCFERCYLDPIKNPTALRLLQSEEKIHPIDFSAQKIKSGRIQEIFELLKPQKAVLKNLSIEEQTFLIRRTVLLFDHLEQLLGFSWLYYHPSVQINQSHKF